jgi:sterol desaturase/sphingolipid hydroxylase (fatty acid hydroxylase superfamily)
MERLLTLFAFLGSLYLIFFLLERLFPLRKAQHSIFTRIATNAAMSALAFASSALFVQPVVKRFMQMGEESQIGLLKMLDGHWSIQLIGTFLLLDLSFYYWHRLNHEWSFLWRFHNVHHIDQDLDVSTGFRFHPGEIVFSAGFRAVQISLLGVSGWAFLAYEAVFQAATLFHHSNLKLPYRLERALNFVFVTPRMHGLHHSVLKDETNSNYSVVFSFWDRIHQSLTPISRSESRGENPVGVPAYRKPLDNSLSALLIAPFAKQRRYWENE